MHKIYREAIKGLAGRVINILKNRAVRMKGPDITVLICILAAWKLTKLVKPLTPDVNPPPTYRP